MKITFSGSIATVTREATDGRMANESQLLYRIKVQLRKDGKDVIKKLMSKDGHMVSDGIHYIRERKGRYAIWNSSYALFDAAELFNRDGSVNLAFVQWAKGEQP